MPSSVQEAGDLPRPGGRGEERGLGERWESRKGGGGGGGRGRGPCQGRLQRRGLTHRGRCAPRSPRPQALRARLYHSAALAGGAAATVAPGGGLWRQQGAAERQPSLATDSKPGGAEAGGTRVWGAVWPQSLPCTPPRPVVGARTQTKAGGE